MKRLGLVAVITFFVTLLGCSPPVKKFQQDFMTHDAAYRDAPDAQAAKAVLLGWEKVLAKYEKKTEHTPRIPLTYHQTVMYGRLFRIHTRLGETNQAKGCQEKLIKLLLKEASPGTRAEGIDLQTTYNSIDKIDYDNGVRWRQSR